MSLHTVRRVDGVMLQPELTWKPSFGLSETVAPDESVGYGRTWTARRPRQLAVIPLGFADGYSRSPGRRGRALIRGFSTCVVERVYTDILMADI